MRSAPCLPIPSCCVGAIGHTDVLARLPGECVLDARSPRSLVSSTRLGVFLVSRFVDFSFTVREHVRYNSDLLKFVEATVLSQKCSVWANVPQAPGNKGPSAVVGMAFGTRRGVSVRGGVMQIWAARHSCPRV